MRGLATRERLGVYLTSRGQPNENYFAAQKAMRAMGTNSIDNAARVCHSPSTFGLKGALGVAATTCSYTDWIGTDLIVFIGSNVANNQPVAMKYLYHAKKAGTKVACVNPYREPGMDRYWVPSNVESAVFGTKITDRFFVINVGGDIGFLNGALKHMIEQGWTDARLHRRAHQRLRRRWPPRSPSSPGRSWRTLSGSTRAEMLALAELLRDAKTAIFVWSMGITQHEFGEDNVRAIINLGLSKGFVGREQLRPDADPRALRGAGRRRDGRLRHGPARRGADRRGQRRAVQQAVGLRRAHLGGPDRAGDDRRRARRASSTS